MNARRALRRLFTFLALAAIAILLGAPRGAAAADSVSQTRNVAAFDHIRLQGAFDVTVTAGAAQTAVVVTAPDGIVDRVTTNVRDRELIVGMKPGTNNLGSTPQLDISVPALLGFANEGAGSAKISGLAGGDFDISNAGTATIIATGRADALSISLNGTGRIDTTGLAARDVSVDNNGVGSVRVRASGRLTMAVNGIGDIRYTGNPAHVDSHVNGIGHIGPL